jgi:predicted small secreted protein
MHRLKSNLKLYERRIFMKSRIIKHLLTGLTIGFVSIGLLAGCNTVKGLGQDVEKGGQKLQSTAKQQQVSSNSSSNVENNNRYTSHY